MRRAAWVLVAVGLLILGVVLPLRGLAASDDDFNRIVGWANILAYSVGAVGLLLMVIDRRRSSSTPSPSMLDNAADQLAGQVLTQEGQQRARLLGTGRVTTTAANLRYEADRLVRFRATGSAQVGDLEGVARFFAEHTDGRLVILGNPGSGKTVLALELLIQLLEQRHTVADPQVRAVQPVPVRFSLPAWNTDRPLPDWLGSDLAARFGLSDAVALGAGRATPDPAGTRRLGRDGPPGAAPTPG